jgi:hypothetical protein
MTRAARRASVPGPKGFRRGGSQSGPSPSWLRLCNGPRTGLWENIRTMAIKITHDAGAPTASIEFMITQPLPDYDLEEVEAPIPRDVDPMLASQGFKDLLDETRAVLERELPGANLEIAQLTGAICHDKTVHRPGIWLVLRERNAGKEMSAAAIRHVARIAETIRSTFSLS